MDGLLHDKTGPPLAPAIGDRIVTLTDPPGETTHRTAVAMADQWLLRRNEPGVRSVSSRIRCDSSNCCATMNSSRSCVTSSAVYLTRRHMRWCAASDAALQLRSGIPINGR